MQVVYFLNLVVYTFVVGVFYGGDDEEVVNKRY